MGVNCKLLKGVNCKLLLWTC